MSLDTFLAKVAAEVTHAPCAWGRTVNPHGSKAPECGKEPKHLLVVPAEGVPGATEPVRLVLCDQHNTEVRDAFEGCE